MKIKGYIAAILTAFSLAAPLYVLAQSHVNRWEEAKSINGNFKAVVSQPDIDVFSAPNQIMIKVNQDVDVRIFTILGKLISEEHLEPGIFQFNTDSHGIYIVKTDKTTCKIAI